MGLGVAGHVVIKTITLLSLDAVDAVVFQTNATKVASANKIAFGGKAGIFQAQDSGRITVGLAIIGLGPVIVLASAAGVILTDTAFDSVTGGLVGKAISGQTFSG
jgi:hypothetical protein